MMGSNPGLDNGNAFMRAQREAAQQAINPGLTPAAWHNLPPDERRRLLQQLPQVPYTQPEPEDTTGLKMLDEFLAKRRRARDGDGDERE
jgi:hypothetical protein